MNEISERELKEIKDVVEKHGVQYVPANILRKILGFNTGVKSSFVIDHNGGVRATVFLIGWTLKSQSQEATEYIEYVREAYMNASMVEPVSDVPDGKRHLYMDRRPPNSPYKNIAVYLFNVDDKKVLPISHKTPFTPENVNSGFSFESTVLIFRKEEVEKVLLHEMLHLLKKEGDIREWQSSSIEKLLDGCEERNGALYEAYVEFCAVLLMSVREIGHNQAITLRGVLNKHLEFTAKQIAKIVFHFGATNMKEFFEMTESKKICLNRDTHVFAYFIVKGALLYITVFAATSSRSTKPTRIMGMTYAHIIRTMTRGVNARGFHNMINSKIAEIIDTGEDIAGSSMRMTPEY